MAFSMQLTPLSSISATGSAWMSEGAATSPWPQPAEAISNCVVAENQDLHIQASWTVSGFLASILTGGFYYKCTAYVEGYGSSTIEADYPAASTIPHVAVSTPQPYSVDIIIPSGTLTPGNYRVALSMTLYTPGNVPMPFVGFEELPVLCVFDAP